MKEIEKDIKAHLVVCCREKENPDKACCARRGAEKMALNLKDWVKENKLKNDIKISTSTTCLGHCKMGIAMALYPQNKWFLEVSPKDEPKIKEMLMEYAK